MGERVKKVKRAPEIPGELWGLWHDEFGWEMVPHEMGWGPMAFAVYATKEDARRCSITNDGERLGRPVRIGVAPPSPAGGPTP